MATAILKKNIRVIPATTTLRNENSKRVVHKLKVAAYARVSTDLEEQEKSYEAQVDYYKKYIKNNENWDFVEVYADEGITGLSTKHRDGFNRMINDALAGKIDLILTKSISRFARNTVDSIETIRKLKEKDIEVIFEKENIRTLDPSCELVLTIMASLAQEESRSISQNCTWGQRKRFSDGKYSVAYTRFLGYDNDFKINEKEAEVVRLIFNLFINGKSYAEIRDELKLRNIKTVTGKSIWEISVIKNILKNEKYCGDALLQKCYTKDYITKKHVKNKGNVEQFYVEKGHEGIVDHITYELARIMVKRKDDNRLRNLDIFSGKLICKECGGKYYKNTDWSDDGSKTWITYKCDNKYRKGCISKSIKIDQVKITFLDEINKKISKNPQLISLYKGLVIDLIDADSMIDKRNRVLEKLKNIKNTEVSNEMIETKERCINNLNEEIDIINTQIEIDKKRLEKINNFNGILKEFDDDLFVATVDKVIIDKNKNVEIVLKNE